MTKDLFAEFPSQSKEEWIEQVVRERKGRAYEELRHKWSDEVEMEPFYHPDDQIPSLDPIGKTSGSAEWKVGAHIEVEAGGPWKQWLTESIEGGVRAIYFTLSGNQSIDALSNAVASKDADIYLTAATQKQGKHFLESIEMQEGTVGISILNSDEATVQLWNQHPSPMLQCTLFEDYDEDPVLLLTSLLSRWQKMMQNIPEQGRNDFAKQTHFVLPIGSYYLVEIAKIRALKILWINLMNHLDLPIEYPHITSCVSEHLYGEDQQINHIKATVSAMSGVLGGADHLVVHPVQAAGEATDSFSHRIARNILHILKLESYFDKVTDPVAGSFYLDHLTQKMAIKSWDKI